MATPGLEQLVAELARTENPARVEQLLQEALETAYRDGYVAGLRVAVDVVRPSETHGILPHPVRVALETAANTLKAGAGVAASGRPWPARGGR